MKYVVQRVHNEFWQVDSIWDDKERAMARRDALEAHIRVNEDYKDYEIFVTPYEMNVVDEHFPPVPDPRRIFPGFATLDSVHFPKDENGKTTYDPHFTMDHQTIWNFDSTLALMIAEAMDLFIEHVHMGIHVDSEEESTEEWKSKCVRIRDACLAYVADDTDYDNLDFDKEHEKTEKKYQDMKEAFLLLHELLPGLWT